jgi:arginyl-tRNA synthetase
MTNENLLQNALAEAAKAIGLEVAPSDITIETSKDPAHGDYATNLAMKSASRLHKAPKVIAQELLDHLSCDVIDHAEIASPGFMNFFLKKESMNSIVSRILNEGDHYGDGADKHFKIDVEFVSANPTGDLHLGHTRGAALGDAIANLYQKAGYDVTREYYVNDCGNQVEHLGHSIRERYHELYGETPNLGPDDYHGVDLIAIAKSIQSEYGDKYLTDTKESHDFFIRYGIDKELGKIKKDMADFGVHFDRFSYESDIRKGTTIQDTIQFLRDKGYVYEKDGATYLKTTAFLDDKDRPIIKKDGLYTYFMPDICYHYDKMARGYQLLVDCLGADHFGYLNRMRSALMMKGYSPDCIQFEIYQIVKVYKDGEEVKMSKRTGKGITHRELVEEVGKDAVRYFFCERSSDAHLDFNMNLATSKSKDNPVYYAQYAYARCASLLEMGKDIALDPSAKTLHTEKEAKILKQLADFSSMIENAAEARAPYKVAGYVQTLARMIHEYYAATKIIDREDIPGTASRLALCKACQVVLKNALALLGVGVREKM